MKNGGPRSHIYHVIGTGNCCKQLGVWGAVCPLAGPVGVVPGTSGDLAISEALKWLKILAETLFEYGYLAEKQEADNDLWIP